jgi:hypothetical protein
MPGLPMSTGAADRSVKWSGQNGPKTGLEKYFEEALDERIANI